MLDNALAVIGPPASGKTTLTMKLGQSPGQRVFRLREHVPEAILASTATMAEPVGRIDDLTVILALHSYLDPVVEDHSVHTVLLDNFPGSGQQVRLLLSTLRKIAPNCVVCPVELVADPATLKRRTAERRVCHHCERDPLHDPQLPAEPSRADPRRCARCGNVLHPRRADAPRLFAARMERYMQSSGEIREAFANTDIPVLRLQSDGPIERVVNELLARLGTRSAAS